MSLVSIDWKPSDRHLRQFATAALVVLPALTWIWSGGNRTAVAILTVVGAVIALTGWLSPQAIRPLFLALTIAMLPIGIVVGEAGLVIVYFVVFFAVGLSFRLIGRDSMRRTVDKDATTYWMVKARANGRESYFRQW